MPTTATEQPRLRVALQSANRLLRESIADRLERDSALRLVGATASDADLLQLCGLRQPEVVIVDSEESDPSFLVTALRARHQHIRIIGLTGNPDLAIRFQRSGASRVVSPASGLKTLLSAIRPYCWIQREDEEEEDSVEPDVGAVSDDEIRILHLIGSGYTLEQMSAELGLTPSSVERQKRRAFGKLAARSQAQAIARALRLGLLPAGDEPSRRPRRPVDEERPATALLRGEQGPLFDQVSEVLLREGVAVITDHVERPMDADHPAWDTKGPLVVVQVDPDPDDEFVIPDPEAGRLVVLSDDPGQRAMVESLLRGTDAMIPADQVDVALAPAFQLVASGFLVTDANVAHKFMRAGFSRMSQSRSPIPMDLTGREQDILTLIERGHTVRQTARELGISVKTVETLQSRLFRKLGVRCSSEAIVVAHGFGLLQPEAVG